MPKPRPDLLPGTLDMLVLRVLQSRPMHGYAIARWIQQSSEEILQVEEGSLYPALHRMERKGWIEAEWGLSDSESAREVLPTDATRDRATARAEKGLGPGLYGDHPRARPWYGRCAVSERAAKQELSAAQIEAEIAEELGLHLELATRAGIESGLTPHRSPSPGRAGLR